MTEVIRLSDLQPDANNANKGTERGRYMVEQSLRKLGAGRSIVLDKHGKIIAGNKTAETAGEVGIEDVVIIRTKGDQLVAVLREDLDLDDPTGKARELAYADNRAGQVSLEFDAHVIATDLLTGLDLSDWFTPLELGDMGIPQGEPEPADAAPQINRADELQQEWGTELGQLWRLPSRTEGQEHRLICGDCTDGDVVKRVMDGEKATYGMHDPPYGISVVVSSDSGADKPFSNGKIGFDNIVKTNLYAPVVGDDSPFDPSHLMPLSKYHFFWGGNYYADKLPPQKGWVVWDKKGREEWRDNFSDCELAWSDLPIVTRIFRHTWMGMVQEGQREQRVHPTQKPAQLYEKIIRELFIEADGLIIDFYAGSSPTIIAAENLGRQCRAIEISPAYVAVALQRYKDAFGIMPELVVQ